MSCPRTIPHLDLTEHSNIPNLVANSDTAVTAAPTQQDDACTKTECATLKALADNLSLEVTEWQTRYHEQQENGQYLFRQYENRCAALRVTKAHNHNLQQYVAHITKEHDLLRAEYAQLHTAYTIIESLFSKELKHEEERWLDDQQQHTPPQRDDSSHTEHEPCTCDTVEAAARRIVGIPCSLLHTPKPSMTSVTDDEAE